MVKTWLSPHLLIRKKRHYFLCYVNYIEQALIESGQFRTVTYVESNNRSKNHYHFALRAYENKAEGQELSTMYLLYINLLVVPCWGTATMDYRLTVSDNGKTSKQYKSNQYYRNYFWLPLAVAYPFATPTQAERKMTKRAVDHLLQQAN